MPPALASQQTRDARRGDDILRHGLRGLMVLLLMAQPAVPHPGRLGRATPQHDGHHGLLATRLRGRAGRCSARCSALLRQRDRHRRAVREEAADALEDSRQVEHCAGRRRGERHERSVVKRRELGNGVGRELRPQRAATSKGARGALGREVYGRPPQRLTGPQDPFVKGQQQTLELPRAHDQWLVDQWVAHATEQPNAHEAGAVSEQRARRERAQQWERRRFE